MKHTFALFVPNLSHMVEMSSFGGQWIVRDADLYRRTIQILRLTQEEEFIAFDAALNVRLKIEKETFEHQPTKNAEFILSSSKGRAGKRTLICTLIEKKNNRCLFAQNRTSTSKMAGKKRA